MYVLRTEDVEEYTRFLRVPPYFFDELMQLIDTDIQKETTLYDSPISLSRESFYSNFLVL